MIVRRSIGSRLGCFEEFAPTQVLDIDLGRPLPSLPGSAAGGYDKARALIRLHGQPLGNIELQLGSQGITSTELATQTWERLADEIGNHLRLDGLRPSRLTSEGLPFPQRPRCCETEPAPPFISVVIATRDRADSLVTCLASISKLDYPNFEVIVVDNSPTTDATAEVVQRAGEYLANVRYLVESQPGASRARNRGIKESKADIIAFTDDDVVVDCGWLWGFVRGFKSVPNAACVTGLVMPAELETAAQVWFEQYGGFSRGCHRNLFDLEFSSVSAPVYPYNPGAFGAGASMAFRSDRLRDLGGFDTTLGPGTLCKGGEDLDLFLRVILGGHILVYEPTSLAWHRHRRNRGDLHRQIHDYGVGLASLIMKTLLTRQNALDVVRRVPRGIVFLLSPSSPKNAPKAPGYPRVLSLLEIAGVLWGPLAYLRSRRRLAGSGAKTECALRPESPDRRLSDNSY